MSTVGNEPTIDVLDAHAFEPLRADGVAAGLSVAETTAIRDIDAAIRSTRALSEEIQTAPLVESLLTIAIEHAGAQRGLLIRVKGNATLIEAGARLGANGIEIDVAPRPPAEADLPLTMLYTALRMRVPVSVSDSQRPAPYAHDPYLASYPRCAAIIIPLVKGTRLVGLLYLENRLSSRGFTGEQTQVLSLLAAQAAVSLETAQLYAELVEENRERRRVEKALRASRATLLLGERINQSGSWTWDIARGLIHCSAEFRRIFNLDDDASSIEFDTLMQHIHPADRGRVARVLHEAVGAQRPLRLEHRILGRDGRSRHLAVVGQPMGEAEGDVYVGTVSDITRRKTDEDAQRRVQAELAHSARLTTVGQLSAAIAHEVNQPLMAISANAGAALRWLRREPPHITQAQDMLHEIVDQGARAGKIIQTLQALTQRSPRLGEVDLGALVRQAAGFARTDLDRHEITLELDMGARAWRLEGDAVQLRQVLANVIGNAVEALAATEGRERLLRIALRDAGDGQVEVAVDDNGVGVEEALLATMFEPFVSTRPDAMGMGLAICRSIVESHGGGIAAQARRPHGCSLRFTLPAVPAKGAR